MPKIWQHIPIAYTAYTFTGLPLLFAPTSVKAQAQVRCYICSVRETHDLEYGLLCEVTLSLPNLLVYTCTCVNVHDALCILQAFYSGHDRFSVQGYPNGCQQVLLRPYPVRGHRLLFIVNICSG